MGFPTFVLASASSARRQLLQAIGIEAIARPSGFDESQIQETQPQKLVETLARCKAEAIAPAYPDALVLGCDSVLFLDGEIHGKPADAAEGFLRWQRMRGNVGELYTGHVFIDRLQEKTIARTQVTRVYFANPSDRQIRNYIATGEPLRCAGGFSIDGRGGLFVERLEGCHTNVIGLSLPLLRQMLADLGYDATEVWS